MKAGKELVDLLNSFNSVIDGAEKADPKETMDAIKKLIDNGQELFDGDANVPEEMKKKFEDIKARFADNDSPIENLADVLVTIKDLQQYGATLGSIGNAVEATVDNIGDAINGVEGLINKIGEHGKVMAETMKTEHKDWEAKVKEAWEESRDKDGDRDGFGTFLKTFFKESGSTMKDHASAMGHFFKGVFGDTAKDKLQEFAHTILDNAKDEATELATDVAPADATHHAEL